MTRILVTGAEGLLGSALCRAARTRGLDVISLSRADLDVTRAADVSATLGETSPDVVFNCAAFSAVDRAEAEPQEALRVNRDGARWVAEAASRCQSLPVHISTDYVFDGKKKGGPYLTTDPPSPLNVYGISKLAGETAVREVAEEYLVVRTSWLFGDRDAGFVGVMRRLLVEPGDPLCVVEDETSRPTYVEDLAPALLDLVEAGGRGCLHLAGSGACTRLALAQEIKGVLRGMREIQGVSAETFGAPARRPSYSVLDLDGARMLLGRALPTWQDSLRRFLLEDSPHTEA